MEIIMMKQTESVKSETDPLCGMSVNPESLYGEASESDRGKTDEMPLTHHIGKEKPSLSPADHYGFYD